MRVRTRHFAFYFGPDWLDRRWYVREVAIGIGARVNKIDDDGRPDGIVPYRFALRVSFQLLPNFIWYRDRIDQGDGVCFQDRIVGVQGWPFHVWRVR